jgi:DNA modification methylase
MKLNTIHTGDALEVLRTMPDNSIDCCVTSPPYFGLRDYGVSGQIGLEEAPEAYIARLMDVFQQVHRILRPSGSFFLNIADSYAGSGRGKGDINKKGVQSKASHVGDKFDKPYKIEGYRNKTMMMIPYRIAWCLVQQQEWILRNIIIWHKPNQMPSGAKDRFTTDFEPIFFFVKKQKYYFCQQLEPYTKPLNRWDGDNLVARGKSAWAIGTGQKAYRDRNMRPNPAGRNMRTVWAINTSRFKGAHFATYPEKLIERLLLAGCPPGGVVLDPFMGAGTTAVVAQKLGRNYVGIELNPEYVNMANERLCVCV